MADFSSTEKINASWKHLFGILGTANGSGAAGKFWYEELMSASHIVSPEDVWFDPITVANNITAAHAAAGPTVEDRALGENITLVQNGLNWDISTTTITPKIGYQITNVHPNPTYVRSITNVTDLGGGSYTISLNNNSGVSSGAAVLHSRIFLTLDPSSNGMSWFAKKICGDPFSTNINNFIQSQKFGKGYSIRLFQANGTEIMTTQGAWIFHNQRGLLLFASGYTATQMGYTTPLYIEGFRYTGSTGVGTSIPAGNLHDTLRFDGTNYVPTSAVQSDGSNLYIQNLLAVSGSLTVASGVQPPSSGYSGGLTGEFRWDNNFLYIKTETGWARTNIQRF